MSDNYQSWVERVAGGREAKPLSTGEVVKSSAGEPFGAVEFVKVEKKGYSAEVGKKGDFYIYHFYPDATHLANPHVTPQFSPKFFTALEDAFLQVFKNPEQIEAAWVEEMKSFAVRVRGWAHTVWGDDLAIRVIDVLEEKLGA